MKTLGDEPELAELSDDDDLYDDDNFVYDAFVSYTQSTLDVANKIERELEAFLLPREIRKRLGRRHLNVFLDVSDLTGNRLNPALEHNLKRSRTLVVLCSPAARRSRYVSMEIHRFAQLRDAERIIPVLIAGAPNNDPRVDAAEWAFPAQRGARQRSPRCRSATGFEHQGSKGQTGPRFAVGSACREHSRCDD